LFRVDFLRINKISKLTTVYIFDSKSIYL